MEKGKTESKKKKGLLSFLWRRKFTILILVAIAAGAFYFIKSRNQDDIETAEIKKGEVTETLILTGQIQATEHASLIFLSSGELEELYVSEGDVVEKGQRLASLDTTVLYQNYLIAEASLRSAEATVERVYDDLQGKENTETFTQIETRTAAETAKDRAYRNFVIAQKNLANAILRAPFDGIVSQIANPFTDLYVVGTQGQIEIVNPDTLYFEVNADQTEVGQLEVGQEVEIVLDAFLEKEIKGRVSSISYTPKTGEAGTVYSVKVGFSSKDANLINDLRIGMTGDARFVLMQHKDALWVPPEFVNSDKNGKFVNLQRNNNKVYIEIGAEGEDQTEIIGDVSEGQTVYD